MFFKKKKLPSKSKKVLFLPLILGAIGVCVIMFFGIVVVRAMNNINFQVFNFESASGSFLNFAQLSLNNETVKTKEIQYILITGRGGGNHDAPNLTDTIILAGFHPHEQTITLFSLPRDLYVDYPESTKKGKINEIYQTFLPLGEDIAVNRLQQKISEITGKNIDFYINIDFEGFIKIIDTLGGVEVTLDKNFVDYEYPDNHLGYKTFILKKGTWTLDGEVALMYARSRHSTSDFDRSLRQQTIISSLREKLSQLGYLKDRKTFLQLYNIFNTYIETDMTFTDMLSLGLMIKSWDSSQTLSFNLNDSCYDGSPTCNAGGLLYVPLREYFGGASVLLPNSANINKLSDYTAIQEYSDFIYNYTEIYTQPKNIVIFNSTGSPGLAGQLAAKLRPYGFMIDEEVGTKTLREKKFEKSILYYNGIEEDDMTLQALQKILTIDMQKSEIPLYSPTGTHIEIILANDTF